MILSGHNLSKSFTEKVIIRDASFVIEEHEKAAVVGINGAGKSTLLKMIVGELAPDEGEVILSRGKTLGYLAQQKMLTGSGTIWEELLSVKQDVLDAEVRMRSLEQEMKHLSGQDLEDAMDQYHRLNTWFEQVNGYAMESEITGVLKGLGFQEEDFHKHTDTLSGGQKTRVALGRLLLQAPDIILLDEPTNHLDMNSIAWLENYLLNYKGAVIIVAHDRYFLDKVVTKVIEIDQGHVHTFSGNYSDYAVHKKQIRDAQLKAYLNQQAEIKHQEEVITKLRSFNREKSIKRAESREKMLQKMEVLERPTEADTDIHLSLEPRITSGNDVLDVVGLSKAFDDQVLFEDLSFSVKRGERVALIGDNGTGKTTLLKIINGLTEADAGTLTLGTKVMIGYYDQEHQVLHPDKTLFDEISDAYPELNNTQIRNVLAAFLFTGDDVFKQVKDISGGERGRVSLAKLMLSRANFLILDEPTNHLDMYSREILEDALRNYTGTVLYVSHDRYFINRTATRIMDLTEKLLVNYIGNYDYYLEKKEELTAAALHSANRVPAAQARAAVHTASVTSSREDWERSKQQQAQERKNAAALKRTEERIAQLEQEDESIDAQLDLESVYTDLEQVQKLTARKAEIASELEELYADWERLAELVEK